jgi:DNA polymerase-1
VEELVYDIEADNLIPGLTKIWCIGVCSPTKPDEVTTYTDYDDRHPSLQEGLLRLKNAKRLIGHNNVGYDCPAIEKLYPGYVRFEQQWDNMVVAALLNPSRRSLALATFGKEFGFEKGGIYGTRRCVNCACVYRSPR